MQPGVLSLHGFLGSDTRNLGEIVAADLSEIEAAGILPSAVADLLDELHAAADEALRQLYRQGDKIARNALREAFIRAGVCDTKRQAESFVAGSGIPADTLSRRVVRLSLHEAESLDRWVRGHSG